MDPEHSNDEMSITAIEDDSNREEYQNTEESKNEDLKDDDEQGELVDQLAEEFLTGDNLSNTESQKSELLLC
jgi:hypothetical protein